MNYEDLRYGDLLKQARLEAGLTQADLAKRMGVTPQYISQYETGKRRPKYETIKKIAYALEISLADLIDWTDTLSDFDPWEAEDLVRSLSESELSRIGQKSRDRIILDRMHNLNKDGQKKVIEYASDLSENPKYASSSDADPEDRQPD